MEKALLLEKLNGLVTKYQQHRGYIEKARAQAASGKFNAQVIEKVLLDHEIKASVVAEEISPLLPTLQTLIDALVQEKNDVRAGNSGVDEAVQELELRAAIGELTEDEFNTEVADLRTRLDGANTRIAAIDGELEELQGAVSGWAALASPHGHYAAAPASVVVEPAAAVAEPTVSPTPAPTPAPATVVVPPPEPEAVKKGITDDVGPVFTAAATVTVPEDIAIEAAEGADIGGGEEVSFGADEAVVSAPAEVEIDLGGDAPAAPAPAAEPAKEPAKEDDTPRRALLLYQEGTAEEQIYPFTNDALTIGRGRENDIQIKNDSKVSRYHCKLQRRGNNFYIEDAKSSNGTLVNGELITDRRLFGGEEIIIGETFFRFRIME